MDKIIELVISVICIVFLYNTIIYVYPETKNKSTFKSVCTVVLICCLFFELKGTFHVDLDFDTPKSSSYESELISALEKETEEDILENTGVNSKVTITKNKDYELEITRIFVEEDNEDAIRYIEERYNFSKVES